MNVYSELLQAQRGIVEISEHESLDLGKGNENIHRGEVNMIPKLNHIK